ncbi:MAG: aspartyl protease family protein, partial [Polyangiaceae bacterium]
KAFGSEDDVAKSLPITMSGTVTVSGKTGKYEESIDTKRLKSALHLKGLERANGIDENGAWQLGNSGGISRVRPGEMRATDEWILRRHYLSAFQADRDVAICHVSDGKKRFIVEEKIAELGSPRLVFDPETAELVGSQFVSIEGQLSTRTVTWSPRSGSAPSWPAHSSGMTEGQSTIEMTTDQVAPAAADAFAVSAPFLDIAWPRSATVKVPMKLYGGELLIDVTIGGKKAHALLDSGAGISVVEAAGKSSASFTPELEFDGQSASQKIKFGIGTLADVQVGGLTIKNIPAARVPIPMFDQFGPNRPDLVLGWSLFEGHAVRVDYAKNEIVFARDAAALHAANATSVDVRDLGDKLLASIDISTEGQAPDVAHPEAHDSGAGLLTPQLQVDTGNASTISLSSAWAKANKYPPSSAKVATMRGQFSAGTNVTSNQYFRTGFKIGPIKGENELIEVSDSPDTGIVGGLLGNLVLAKCQAVVFDVPNRKVWFDGPCDRKPAESHMWWTLTRKDDPAAKDHPWIVVSTAAHGSADAAGVASGDRIVAIDGKPVGLAYDFMGSLVKPVGASIAITVLRGTETKKLTTKITDPF